MAAKKTSPKRKTRIDQLREALVLGFRLKRAELEELEAWARRRMTVAERQVITRVMLSCVAGKKPGVRHHG